jgi:hypothetical protein
MSQYDRKVAHRLAPDEHSFLALFLLLAFLLYVALPLDFGGFIILS